MVTDRIEREIAIAAPPQRVWEVVTRAEHLGAWLGDAGAEIDLRPGGRLVLHWKDHGTAHGRVETVDAYSTFAFRWVTFGGDEPTDDNSTLVEFTLTPQDGGTRLRVVETGFAGLAVAPDQQEKHLGENTEGWRLKLDELRTYSESVHA